MYGEIACRPFVIATKGPKSLGLSSKKLKKRLGLCRVPKEKTQALVVLTYDQKIYSDHVKNCRLTKIRKLASLKQIPKGHSADLLT
jgi:hypothetical protein